MPRLPAEIGVDVDEHPPADRGHVRRPARPSPGSSRCRASSPTRAACRRRSSAPRTSPAARARPAAPRRPSASSNLPPHHLGAALQPGDQPLVHPVRQRPHPPGIVGIGLDQLERRRAVEDPPGHHPRPDLDVELPRSGAGRRCCIPGSPGTSSAAAW